MILEPIIQLASVLRIPLLPRWLVYLLVVVGSDPAFADATADSLRAEIARLRDEQVRIDELQRQANTRIRALEVQLESRLAAKEPTAPVAPSAPSPDSSADAPRLALTGDLRLRYQGDYSDSDAPNRDSGQIRSRVGATFAVNDRVTIAARIVTGDPDDPNSTDVQLSNFDDDLQTSLDLAYAQLNLGGLRLYGGKIPHPFTRTDLLWDSDVNPQGLGAVYRRSLAHGSAFRTNGLFFIIDEQIEGPESTVKGAQFGYDSAHLGDWSYEVSAAYYDYHLGSVVGGDAGDFRSNLRNPDGSYLSDFDLGDLVIAATWSGAGTRWPLRAVADYVKNFGAKTSADKGYGFDVALGSTLHEHDWRVTYGYSVAETDSVFAAFSHDNLSIGTNYRLHSLTFDYVPLPKTLITAIWYHYRPDSSIDAGADAVGDWLDRFRVAFLMSF